jgi:hypothetical protein
MLFQLNSTGAKIMLFWIKLISPSQISLVILHLKSLLADSEQTKLLRRLSEANQYNRLLKRQVRLLLQTAL